METRTAGGRTSSGSEAAGTSRTASQDHTFYFYKGLGQPLHTTAGNLAEFVEVMQGLDLDSIQFHLERGDFERWFKMLGEESLANQAGGLRGKDISSQELRTELSLMVGSRIDQQQQRRRQEGRGTGTPPPRRQ